MAARIRDRAKKLYSNQRVRVIYWYFDIIQITTIGLKSKLISYSRTLVFIFERMFMDDGKRKTFGCQSDFAFVSHDPRFLSPQQDDHSIHQPAIPVILHLLKHIQV